MSDPAVLRPGSRGEAVRDLQVRLGALGHEIPPVEAGAYGAALIALDELLTARAAEETDPQREAAMTPVHCTAPRRARVRSEEHLLQRREKSLAV